MFTVIWTDILQQVKALDFKYDYIIGMMIDL